MDLYPRTGLRYKTNHSKARFQSSIPWQLKTFPKNLCGAVPGRQASDISHSLAISNELAISKGQGRIGIKLDRSESKCFDRVIPQLICELGSSLGLDKGFLRAWCAVYTDFKRYITYGAFISKNNLESKNGIAQGDCASVLAINILMCAWTRIMACVTNVRSYIFIDDAYVDAEARHILELVAAVKATELFDEPLAKAIIGETLMAKILVLARKEIGSCQLCQLRFLSSGTLKTHWPHEALHWLLCSSPTLARAHTTAFEENAASSNSELFR